MNCNFYLIFATILQLHTLLAHDYSNLHLYRNSRPSSVKISATPSYLTPAHPNFSRYEAKCLAAMLFIPKNALTEYLTSIPTTELFLRFYFYSNQNYLDYIRLRPGYYDFIIKLHQEIHRHHSFRKSLRGITGFKRKRGFQELIDNEVKIVKQKKATEQHAHYQKMVLQNLYDQFQKQYVIAQTSQDHFFLKQCQQRIRAVTKTMKDSSIFDYSNIIDEHPTFTDRDAHVFDQHQGTFLDKQLHKELCFTRTTMHDLLAKNQASIRAQAFAAMIDQLTALTKQEQAMNNAFNLSDCAHNLVRIISGGINILNTGIDYAEIGVDATLRGMIRGVQTSLNPQHWKEMGFGLLELGVFFANEAARIEAFNNAIISSVVTNNPDILMKASKELEQHYRGHAQIVEQSLQQLKHMTWEQLIENSAQFGTEFVLDGVICHAATLAATKGGRALVNELAAALNSGTAHKHVVEIIGVGKIALEEGPEVANAVVETVKKNPEVLVQEGKSTVQVLKEVAKEVTNKLGTV